MAEEKQEINKEKKEIQPEIVKFFESMYKPDLKVEDIAEAAAKNYRVRSTPEVKFEDEQKKAKFWEFYHLFVLNRSKIISNQKDVKEIDNNSLEEFTNISQYFVSLEKEYQTKVKKLNEIIENLENEGKNVETLIPKLQDLTSKYIKFNEEYKKLNDNKGETESKIKEINDNYKSKSESLEDTIGKVRTLNNKQDEFNDEYNKWTTNKNDLTSKITQIDRNYVSNIGLLDVETKKVRTLNNKQDEFNEEYNKLGGEKGLTEKISRAISIKSRLEKYLNYIEGALDTSKEIRKKEAELKENKYWRKSNFGYKLMWGLFGAAGASAIVGVINPPVPTIMYTGVGNFSYINYLRDLFYGIAEGSAITGVVSGGVQKAYNWIVDRHNNRVEKRKNPKKVKK